MDIKIKIMLVGMLAFSFLLDMIFNKSRKAKYKGKKGEATVSSLLKKLPDAYRVINDVVVKSNKGVTQIDHVVVSEFGIFVIETKNYKGVIIGSPDADKWKQKLGNTTNNFYNPLRQNYGHIKALQTLTGLPESAFISIIAFSLDAKLRVDDAEGRVVYFNKLTTAIKGHQEKLLTTEQAAAACEAINAGDIESKEVMEKHNQDIKVAKAEEESKIEQNICPKCGGKLVARSGKYGEFIGCSNYPKCRFTKDV